MDLGVCGDAAGVLVNKAGLQHVAPVEEFPPERFAVMLLAPFRLAQAVLPGMYERGWGRVVNISSVHGLRASVPRITDGPMTTGRPGMRSGLVRLSGLPGPLGGTLARSELIYLLVHLGQGVHPAPPQAALEGLGP
jgi:NAD(P)-dependent dehydrogenase (short-subunit alcohol dehydrogenase family)